MTDNHLHMIAYISQAKQPYDAIEKDIIDIMNTAKEMNPQFDITGVLFFNQGLFMQVIEGQQSHLNQLMKNIKADSRHEKLEILIDESVSKRGFPSWNMDCFNLSAGNILDKAKLIQVGKEYKENLLPRADVFVQFYKVILEHSNS